MLIEHRGVRPSIHVSAYIAPTAVVCGDVTVGPECRILFGAVLTAEGGEVVIGARSIVMEHAVIRGARRHPARIGSDVLIGPHAHLSGCTVENEAFIATGAAIFNGATIGTRAEVRINGVVHVRSRLMPDDSVPIGWIAVGDPATILPPGAHESIAPIQRALDFSRTVFGVDPDASQAEVTARYGPHLGEHRLDHVLAAPQPWAEPD